MDKEEAALSFTHKEVFIMLAAYAIGKCGRRKKRRKKKVKK